jgi:hypothetical protein
MSKKIAGEEEVKESVLSKITNFFKANKGASVAETVADDEEEAKKADDEEEMAAQSDDDAEAKSDDEEMDAKKADDPDDDDDDDSDPDKDDDDDSDEDEIEINGSKVNLKDRAATRAAIEGLLQINAAQNELLQEAADELAGKETVIATQETQIKKTTEQVKAEIKSSFIPKASKRSTKLEVKEEIAEVFNPKEGTMASRVLQATLAKAKANKK